MKKQKQRDYIFIIQVFCGENELDYEVIRPSQIRVGETLDIYPNSNKYFNLTRQQWGIFDDIIKFIHSSFKINFYTQFRESSLRDIN